MTTKDQIIKVVQSIFSQGTFVVETFNESVLTRLMEMNKTPITNYKSCRDNKRDYKLFIDEILTSKDKEEKV